jgi:hypothetical protein
VSAFEHVKALLHKLAKQRNERHVGYVSDVPEHSEQIREVVHKMPVDARDG